jgi:ACS family pantothenate transporter-like MFS transporter
MASLENADTPASQHTKEARLSISSPELSQHDTDVLSAKASKPTELWIRFMTFLHWYPKDMPFEEKSLTLKLDLSILIFGCLSFFTKYLDQQSITNAYVR